MTKRELWFELRETLLAARGELTFPKTFKGLMALARDTRRMIKEAFPEAA